MSAYVHNLLLAEHRIFTPLEPPTQETYLHVEEALTPGEGLQQRSSALTAREITLFNDMLQRLLRAKFAVLPSPCPLAAEQPFEIEITGPMARRIPGEIIWDACRIPIAVYGAGYQIARDDFLRDPGDCLDRMTTGLVEAAHAMRNQVVVDALRQLPVRNSQTLSDSVAKLRADNVEIDTVVYDASLVDIKVPEGLIGVPVKNLGIDTYVVGQWIAPEPTIRLMWDKGFEVMTNVAATDPAVFHMRRFSVAIERYTGALIRYPERLHRFAFPSQ